MSWEYLHLITHPFAIVLSVTGAAVGLAGWVMGRESLERFGLLALLLAALSAVPSYLTGVASADDVSARTFVEPSIVQTHRTWATWAAISLVTCGIFTGFALFQPGDRRLRRFVLLVGVVGAALTGMSAFRGGKIVHGEDMPGAVQPASKSPGDSDTAAGESSPTKATDSSSSRGEP